LRGVQGAADLEGDKPFGPWPAYQDSRFRMADDFKDFGECFFPLGCMVE
jgi:hypothetical protein